MKSEFSQKAIYTWIIFESAICCPHRELTLPFTLVTKIKQNKMKSECPALPKYYECWPGSGAKVTIRCPAFNPVLTFKNIMLSFPFHKMGAFGIYHRDVHKL